jgi:hypothetical protein
MDLAVGAPASEHLNRHDMDYYCDAKKSSVLGKAYKDSPYLRTLRKPSRTLLRPKEVSDQMGLELTG